MLIESWLALQAVAFQTSPTAGSRQLGIFRSGAISQEFSIKSNKIDQFIHREATSVLSNELYSALLWQVEDSL